MKEVIKFETRLAMFTEPDENRRDEEKAYHIMPISELQNLAPFVSILGLKKKNVFLYLCKF